MSRSVPLAESSRAASAADALLAAWPRVSPAIRSQMFDVLARRRDWVNPLLAAMEAGKVKPADASAAQRDRLLKHADAAVRTRAEKAFAAVRTASRAQALEKARPALSLAGNPAAGAAVFARACAVCHQLNGTGSAVGPNLAAITDRSGPAVLTAIVDPNAAVEGRYTAYNVETTDGRSLSGLIVDETAAGFTVLQGGGLREAVARSAVRKVAASGLSMMPEGLEEGLQPQELADVIAYVQSNETPQTLSDLLLNPNVNDPQRGEALARRPDLAAQTLRVLVDAWLNLAPKNREVAAEALFRDERRALALLEVFASGNLKLADVSDSLLRRLRQHASKAVRKRAGEVLGK
jgi:putative heme-binding domain-containing protein